MSQPCKQSLGLVLCPVQGTEGQAAGQVSWTAGGSIQLLIFFQQGLSTVFLCRRVSHDQSTVLPLPEQLVQVSSQHQEIISFGKDPGDHRVQL